MKSFFTWSLLTVAIALLAMMPVGFGQGQAAPDKTFDGQLTSIDTAAKSITVKGADKEMVFSYTDQTPVMGAEKSVQALNGKTGTHLKISYQERGGGNLATRIEVLAK